MSDVIEPVICPICGKEAEDGAVHSRDVGIQWIKGKPDWKTRLRAGTFGSYETIGQVGLILSSYAPGILCRSCRRVILEFPERKEYFPDVKK